MPLHLLPDHIVQRAGLLPAFPAVVKDVLRTLDDEAASLSSLTDLVAKDPVITARIFALANSAASASRSRREIRDIQVALSLIGMARLREIVLTVSIAEFSRACRMDPNFWRHSVAVGVATQELARVGQFSADIALVCGLVHDIGSLWMARCQPLEFQMVRNSMGADETLDIIEAERRHFGVDHCWIGAVLAQAWGLPEPVIAAIAHHHDPEPPLDKLVAATHVGEVLANALDLAAPGRASVRHLSAAGCDLLGLDWSQDMSFLFGRIEARVHHLGRFFD
ncbi:MAG: HDOD domain-containing protein [Azonexus sp.]